MTGPGAQVFTALNAAYEAGREAANNMVATARTEDRPVPTAGMVATEAMSAMAKVLNDARVLQDPPEPVPEMTLDDAAKLLCRLSRTRRLDDPETDYVQLLEGERMVDYAWSAAMTAGLPPAEATSAHQAYALLLAHHAGQPTS